MKTFVVLLVVFIVLHIWLCNSYKLNDESFTLVTNNKSQIEDVGDKTEFSNVKQKRGDEEVKNTQNILNKFSNDFDDIESDDELISNVKLSLSPSVPLEPHESGNLTSFGNILNNKTGSNLSTSTIATSIPVQNEAEESVDNKTTQNPGKVLNEETKEDDTAASTEEKKPATEPPSTTSDKQLSKSQLNQIYKFIKNKKSNENEDDLLHKLHDKFLLDFDHEKHDVDNENIDYVLSHMLQYVEPEHAHRFMDLFDHYYNSLMKRNKVRNDGSLVGLLENNQLLKRLFKNKRSDSSDLDDILSGHYRHDYLDDSNNYNDMHYMPFEKRYYDHFDHRYNDLHHIPSDDNHYHHDTYNHFNDIHHRLNDVNHYDHDVYNHFDDVHRNSYRYPYNMHHFVNRFHNNIYDNFGHPIYADNVSPLLKSLLYPVNPRIGYNPDRTSLSLVKATIRNPWQQYPQLSINKNFNPESQDLMKKFVFNFAATQQLRPLTESVAAAYCSNYPDHSTEGFKNFIAVETCNEPAGVNYAGIPIFYNGCTFRYTCENGFSPYQGPFTSLTCTSGFWSGRAICVKEVNFKIKRDEIESGQVLKPKPESVNQIYRVRRDVDEIVKYDETVNNASESINQNETAYYIPDEFYNNTQYQQKTEYSRSYNESEVNQIMQSRNSTQEADLIKSSKSIEKDKADGLNDNNSETKSENHTSEVPSDFDKTVYEEFSELLNLE